MSQIKLGGGLRHNDNKLRYDLVNPYAHEGLVKVLTKGAKKYADHNWEAGMLWSKVIASLKRHLAAFELGEDYDFYPETCEDCRKNECIIHTGELHADQLQTNAHFLSAYYRIFPQGDDRYLKHRPQPKIGLDIDDVICSWVGEWCTKFGKELPNSWYFQWNLMSEFERLKLSGELNEFYLNLPVKTKSEDIPFVPECYITHRPVAKEVTEAWLEKNNFPLRPVYQVTKREDKLQVAKDLKLDIFVDDSYDTFKYLNENGVCCFLFDASHNQRYNVGYKRIKSLKELIR